MNELVHAGESPGDILPLVLLLLITTMISGIVCMFSVLYYLRNRRSAGFAESDRSSSSYYSPSDKLVPGFVFDRPRCWLAIRSRNMGFVQEALGLENANACSWMEGLSEAASDNRFFVSPPIRGWILVFGSHLPRPSDDIDHCFCFLTTLSQALGEVQFFCGDSVTDEHGWARLVNGKVVRGYAWFRETLWNQGCFSDAERKAGVKTYDYGDAPDPLGARGQEHFWGNTERLYPLAGHWSVDPSQVSQADLLTSGLGGSGNVSSIQPL